MSTTLDTAKGTPQGPPDGTQGSLVSLLSKLDVDTKTLSVHNIERDESDAENNAGGVRNSKLRSFESNVVDRKR